MDDIERLKTEFNEQKREIKEQNEAELEGLRRYESTTSHTKSCVYCVGFEIQHLKQLNYGGDSERVSVLQCINIFYLDLSLGILRSDCLPQRRAIKRK